MIVSGLADMMEQTRIYCNYLTEKQEDMISVEVLSDGKRTIIESPKGNSLLDILRTNGFHIYAPCGGKGTCGKCRVTVEGEGVVTSCTFYPKYDIKVILPGDEEAKIIVNQTEELQDLPYKKTDIDDITPDSYGIAVDIGTTTIVLYFLNLYTGQIDKISSALNPQKTYGGDIISRINYCQENENGLIEMQQSITRAINVELANFKSHRNISFNDFRKMAFAGNTTMLHFLLKVDALSIALAPFTPQFTEQQIRKGVMIGLDIHPDADIITIPNVSAYVGADILAGLTAIKSTDKNYLFIDVGTNGEMALHTDGNYYVCSTAAGPAFEGANISCGMGAVQGALSGFESPDQYHVIGNIPPIGICGSGIVDIVAYLLKNNMIDETGLLENTFHIYREKGIHVTQQDIREIQLAKSAIYSGLKILLSTSGLDFNKLDALYLAGGFGNYIGIQSAIQIGLLPVELKDKIKPVGNSAGIGALQYLKNNDFVKQTEKVLKHTEYVELSNVDEFDIEFALNMNFDKSINI